jgi:plasmid stability protein
MKRATIYFDPALHQALRIRAAHGGCSISDLVNEAVRDLLRDDADDLDAFETRVAEPTMTYEALLKDLRKHGRL